MCLARKPKIKQMAPPAAPIQPKLMEVAPKVEKGATTQKKGRKRGTGRKDLVIIRSPSSIGVNAGGGGRGGIYN